METAERIKNLPPYLFAEIDRMIAKAKNKGVDVISFGIGDPDQPTPNNIVNEIKKAVEKPETHSYPSYEGLYSFRQEVANWYQNNYNVKFDPEKEIVSLIGSKEGIAHLPFCFINQGDKALVPDPGYPVYQNSVLLAGGKPVIVPLKEKNNFLPDLESIPVQEARDAKLFFLNYPNNPTGAVAGRDFYEQVVAFAKKYDIIIAHDAAYSEIGLDNYQPLSFMEIDGAREVGIEFNSLSKPYNMTGWRIGWALGQKDIIEALGRLKTNIDSGIFEAVQYAGIEALKSGRKPIAKINQLYTERRNLLVEGLKKLGWPVQKNKASFYLWVNIPETGYSSQEYSRKLFQETGVFLTPGIGYGDQGEGFLRIALTVNKERIKEALQRLKDNGFSY
ncbi:MAG: LL-diaminopimelate aminotransferase [Bacillota bacterium]